MSFKDFIAQDAAVFLNPDEFGELHLIDDVEMLIVIDENENHGRSRQPLDLYNAANGVFVSSITIYARASEFEYEPVNGQHLEVDGKMYRVEKCSNAAGILQILLEANDA